MARTNDHTYLRNRARLKRNEDTCAWCGHWIDPDLQWPDPWSFSADHVVPVSRGGHNRGALQAMHLHCNRVRGTKLANEITPPHGRQW